MTTARGVNVADNASVLLSSRASVPNHIVYRSFVNETVILNLETGRYHGINTTGGRILELLEREGTLAAAAARLAEEYDRTLEEAQRHVIEFCNELHERGLIAVSPDDRG